jgi:hypothetical protein
MTINHHLNLPDEVMIMTSPVDTTDRRYGKIMAVLPKAEATMRWSSDIWTKLTPDCFLATIQRPCHDDRLDPQSAEKHLEAAPLLALSGNRVSVSMDREGGIPAVGTEG